MKETAREKLNAGTISEDEYFIEYGKQQERVRILDALNESDIDTITIHRIRKIIKEQA
jgi:hypothetical protein